MSWTHRTLAVKFDSRRGKTARRGQLLPRSKAWFAVSVMASTAASLSNADDLRSPESFSSTGDQAERSRAIFIEAGRVFQHPRCLNCHPAAERPTQGEDLHPHSPLVVRGLDDRGAAALRCTTCHGAANFAPSGVPGHPLWHMAPGEMAWQGKSLAQICEQSTTAAERSRRFTNTWRTIPWWVGRGDRAEAASRHPARRRNLERWSPRGSKAERLARLTTNRFSSPRSLLNEEVA